MLAPIILGVDPGASWTGLTVIEGKELILASVQERRRGESLAAWIHRVLGAIRSLSLQAGVPAWRIAVESVTPPNLYHGGEWQPLAPGQWLIDTAAVMGAVVAYALRGGEAIVVAPGGHGEGPRQAYPAELWSDREPKGKGKLQHARSAYDIALAARADLRRTASAR